ncbi:AAA family ATPase [Sulfitobacter guttiformis]|uniref:ATPase family protein associated with various cellular activities (AAA) n=1 Tax=Sulfitobacter guttiformis TaxID=74349 RepID=A0A420DTN2_9RHOB|nr:AAA family ATPase [Sulfitobacter guttiformis]KIN71211.1 P-loop ATPase [Sulfitobacter guttiformis KCTC 32187]RKE97681.1 ATPase family protein associated with various cellular activities (AAA) [Sulfitobacter guttiformis]
MSVNTTPVSAGAALDALRHGFAAQMAGRLTSSWMLHGRPGIGKTEIVQQLANETGSRLYDLRLTTIEPQDLRGLPFYDHTTKRTVWYPPEDLPQSDDDGPTILFLDELTAAAPSLQPTVYGLLQERRVGQHALPAKTFIIAAGNMVEDGAVAYEMGTALSDRLIHLSLRAEANDWLTSYAVPHGLHEAVTAFIRTRPDLLDTTEETLRLGRMIACTPRSWTRASAILQATPDKRLRDLMLAGTLGDAAAAEFSLIVEDIAATVQAGAMLEARGAERIGMYPRSLHGLTALVYALVTLADAETLPATIDVMAGIEGLAEARTEPEFARLPLGELVTYGFELLIEKALAEGLQEAFRGSVSYAAYLARREE